MTTQKLVTRPCEGNPHQLEYFLTSPEHKGWYTTRDMAEFEECEVNHVNIRKRFKQIGTKYKNMWDAITQPRRKRGQYGKAKADKMADGIKDWDLLNSLMPIK